MLEDAATELSLGKAVSVTAFAAIVVLAFAFPAASLTVLAPITNGVVLVPVPMAIVAKVALI